MKPIQHPWPPDLDKKDWPEYMGPFVNLANRSRSRIRFWLSPIGLSIIVIGGIVAWLLQLSFHQ